MDAVSLAVSPYDVHEEGEGDRQGVPGQDAEEEGLLPTIEDDAADSQEDGLDRPDKED